MEPLFQGMEFSDAAKNLCLDWTKNLSTHRRSAMILEAFSHPQDFWSDSTTRTLIGTAKALFHDEERYYVPPTFEHQNVGSRKTAAGPKCAAVEKAVTVHILAKASLLMKQILLQRESLGMRSVPLYIS